MPNIQNVTFKRYPSWFVVPDATAWESYSGGVLDKTLFTSGAAFIMDHSSITVQDTISTIASSGTLYTNYANLSAGYWYADNGLALQVYMYAYAGSFGQYFTGYANLSDGSNQYSAYFYFSPATGTQTLNWDSTIFLNASSIKATRCSPSITQSIYSSGFGSQFFSSSGPISNFFAGAEIIIDSDNIFYIDANNQTTTTSCYTAVGDYTDITMTTAAEGYTPSTRTITFTTNMDGTSFQSGTAPNANYKEFFIRGENPSAFVYGNIPSEGDSMDLDTFTVTPVAGLKAGTYSTDIVVVANIAATNGIEPENISDAENTVRMRVTFVVT